MSEEKPKSFKPSQVEEITVEIGKTGDTVTIITLNVGQRRKLRERMEELGGDKDYNLAAAIYLALACPEFHGEIDEVFKIEKDDELADLFLEALKFNGIDLNADEDAEKNSESDQS